MLVPCPCGARGLLPWSSAVGAASRRIADALPVRSIAGYYFSGRTESRGHIAVPGRYAEHRGMLFPAVFPA